MEYTSTSKTRIGEPVMDCNFTLLAMGEHAVVGLVVGWSHKEENAQTN
jgi:hypothetical protein